MPNDAPERTPAASPLRRLFAFLTAADVPRDGDGHADPVEIWGRRVGRLLGLVALLALIYGLFHQIAFR
jgi:hypothetical protein